MKNFRSLKRIVTFIICLSLGLAQLPVIGGETRLHAEPGGNNYTYST